jgi:hypothetical protein
MVTADQRHLTARLAPRLAHVRWIAGGTGSGKSTIARILAERFDLTIYSGDRAEHAWVRRCTPERHPYLWAGLQLTHEQRVSRTPEDAFNGMASLHGETIGFLVEDLVATPTDRVIIVDYFGNTPSGLHPLLTWREQAVFLLPTPEFRRRALGARYSNPARARATWGNTDHTRAFANRLARDELWDAELRRQADALDLPIMHIDGSEDANDLAESLAQRFRLTGPATSS